MARRMSSLDLKLVVLGTAGVGKTSIICRYCNGTFIEETLSTIGAGFFTNTLTVNGIEVTMMLWDTAGEERFRSVAPSLLRGANGLILTYDLGSMQSIAELDAYMEMYVDTCGVSSSGMIPVLLLGNKSDMPTREVPEQVVKEWMNKNRVQLHYEVSAKEGTNIDVAFEELLKLLVTSGEADEPEVCMTLTDPPVGRATKKCCS